ncbi:MAG: hypothetical protein J6W84_06325 [Bacteroidales bacterium]|nr:hypothetical protein [Bacteroidales bacterium]
MTFFDDERVVLNLKTLENIDIGFNCIICGGIFCVYHYKVTKCIAPTYAWIVANILEMEKPQYWLTREEAEQALKERNEK